MAKTRSKRISISIVFGIGVFVNYFDRINLSVAHDALQGTFGMSDVLFGYLLSSYNWTYAAMQLPSGALLDRFGVRRVMLVAIMLWSVASGLAAVAPTILLLFAARFLLGIGEAQLFQPMPKPSAYGFRSVNEECRQPPLTRQPNSRRTCTPILGLILLRFGMRANFATKPF